MSEYLLTIRIKFSALDDIVAREKAIEIINESDIMSIKLADPNRPVYKLQQVFPDKQPIGIDVLLGCSS